MRDVEQRERESEDGIPEPVEAEVTEIIERSSEANRQPSRQVTPPRRRTFARLASSAEDEEPPPLPPIPSRGSRPHVAPSAGASSDAVRACASHSSAAKRSA